MRWEARKIRKDGTMLWVRETANAASLKNRPVLLVVCEDITEQKRAEEAARRSERELRASDRKHSGNGVHRFAWALQFIRQPAVGANTQACLRRTRQDLAGRG